MPQFDVVLLVGVGPVRLGMSRDESRAAMLPEAPKTISKSPLAPPVDAYFRAAFQVFFDANERVEFIELYSSSDIDARYEGVDVFRTAASELVAFARQQASIDDTDRELGYSFIFPSLSLAFWRPVMPEGDEEEGRYFSTIAIGVPGYYTRH